MLTVSQRLWRALPGLGIGMTACTPVLAHSPLTSAGAEQWAAISSAAVLVLLWSMYAFGSWRRPPGAARAWCFHGTWLLCVFALLGPLDSWAETSTSAHMTQHMLLMVVIAPLWVLSRPLPQWVAASGPLAPAWRPLLRAARHPMLNAYIHGAIIWFWHTPRFYMLAVEDPWWHVVEHAFFLFSAGLFWWAVLSANYRRMPWAFCALLFTLMHTGFLGALMTFAREPWYGEARDLADQQLAGLIMWVLGAIPYMAAAAWLGYRWFGQLQRRI